MDRFRNYEKNGSLGRASSYKFWNSLKSQWLLWF